MESDNNEETNRKKPVPKRGKIVIGTFSICAYNIDAKLLHTLTHK